MKKTSNELCLSLKAFLITFALFLLSAAAITGLIKLLIIYKEKVGYALIIIGVSMFFFMIFRGVYLELKNMLRKNNQQNNCLKKV